MNNSFLMIEYDLLSSNLTGDEKIILSLIKSWNNDNKECFMSNSTIGDLVGLHPISVSRILNKLKKLGYINIVEIYRKNSKEVEKRILKFISFPTPPQKQDTPKQIVNTPKQIVNTPKQIVKDIILDIKLEDNIKDNNITRPVILGEFGNKEKDNYICNTSEKEMKYTLEEFNKKYLEHQKKMQYVLNLKDEQIKPLQILENEEKLIQLTIIQELKNEIKNEFPDFDENILFEYIEKNEEDRFFLVTKKELTSSQKQLFYRYRKLKSSTEQSEE